MTLIEKSDETHGKDEIILAVYESGENKFTFSVQCHLGAFIRSVFPHSHGLSFKTGAEAKKAAISLLYDWTARSRKTRAQLERFYVLESAQPELDFG